MTIHYGQFLVHPVIARLVKPKKTGGRSVRVYKVEEKGSDVNLATQLLLDGFRQDYEVAIVISGDTDLVGPIRAVRTELNLEVGVFNPYQRSSKELQDAASFYKPVDLTILPRCQFPPTLVDADGRTIRKPASW